MPIEPHVYDARPEQYSIISTMLRTTLRSHMAFGTEDLQHLLVTGHCLVAEADGQVIGVTCASPGRDGYAFLRGLAVVDGKAGDAAIESLLSTLYRRLQSLAIIHLAAYGTDSWLALRLLRAGFIEVDNIITLARHPRPTPGLPTPAATLRSAGAVDVPELAVLDAAAFNPPYRLTLGDLLEVLLHSGAFLVAEQHSRLVGYCCAAVVDGEGQITRLAVLPEIQGQGVGRTLLNHALAYCHDMRASRVFINTQRTNATSLRLYEGFGFRRIGSPIPLLVRSNPLI